MMIPTGPSGYPTVSPTQLRTYGAGGFTLAGQEEPRGCPRQYHAKYIEKRVPEQKADNLRYGILVHRVFYLMEEEGLTPDQALEKAFPADLDPAFWTEAREDLERYLERGASPVDRYGTLAVEEDLDALLYVDEDFGPIYIRAILDWMGVDLDHPNILQVVDYKSQRRPPSTADVRGDVQLKTQHYVAAANAERFGMTNPRVVVHLDAIKFREVEVAFTPQDIEDWHSWCVAVVRKILRDEDHLPVLNPNCDLCPVRGDCPAYATLPDVAAKMATGLAGITDPAERLRWRDAANSVRLLLQKAVRQIDAEFEAQALGDGRLEVGAVVWERGTDWADEIDLRLLHAAMGDAFYDVVSTTVRKVETRTADWPAAERAAVKASLTRAPVGITVTKKKA